jgi:hypothetical protein
MEWGVTIILCITIVGIIVGGALLTAWYLKKCNCKSPMAEKKATKDKNGDNKDSDEDDSDDDDDDWLIGLNSNTMKICFWSAIMGGGVH